MNKDFQEFHKLEEIVEKLRPYADIEIAGHAVKGSLSYPLYVIRMGSKRPGAPTIGFFGGVHGLERIGTKVLLSYLDTIADLMPWDKMLHSLLKHVQFVFMPLVNPIGMLHLQRCNPNDVDLNRNAPLESPIVKWYQPWGGHRISKKLPWYRGEKDAPMEVEAQALCDVVRKYLFGHKVSVVLDVHSGFGMEDQLWFPFAHKREPFAFIAQAYKLKQMLDEIYPQHVYRFEPQSVNYQTHGDLWDYLFLEHRQLHPDAFFLPFTLELGSWAWVKKNPLQLFSALGVFNPVKKHRRKRIFRRHMILFDFLTRAVVSSKGWVDLNPEEEIKLKRDALVHWGLK